MTTMTFYALRSAVDPDSDEDAAAAWKRTGPFDSAESARTAVVKMMLTETFAWLNMNAVHHDHARELARAAEQFDVEDDPNVQGVIVRGVQYSYFRTP